MSKVKTRPHVEPRALGMRICKTFDVGLEFFVCGGKTGLGNLEDRAHVEEPHCGGRVSHCDNV
jgi:hypothetical protein